MCASVCECLISKGAGREEMRREKGQQELKRRREKSKKRKFGSCDAMQCNG